MLYKTYSCCVKKNNLVEQDYRAVLNDFFSFRERRNDFVFAVFEGDNFGKNRKT